MAINTAHWQFRSDRTLRYIGGAHGTATASYASVLEIHRLLQDLGDNSAVTNDDYLYRASANASDKKFDTIITLLDCTLDDGFTTPASEYIYDGTIIQGTGGTEKIYDGVRIVANPGVKVDVIQNNAILTNDFWNSVPNGSKTAATATVSGVNATAQKVLNVSSGTEFAAGDKIMIGTVTDEEYLIDSVSGSALTLTENLATATTGGEAIYFSVRGINPDSAQGIAMRFMIVVRTAGANIDNTALVFQTKEWFYTPSEFRKPSTSRGNNDIPLTYAVDLNNTTPLATVNAFTGITNVTAGFNLIDVNQDATDEEYYSEWNRNTYTINQFYEWCKAQQLAGVATTYYGIAGELFRGITHKVEFLASPAPGAWTEGTELSWGSGATAGTGQLLADDTTNDIAYIQLKTGVVPTDSMSVTDTTNSATTIASNAVTSEPVSTPFCGVSTGTSLVGAFGFSLEYADLAVSDKITALDGITRQPPNNVSFQVGGLTVGWSIVVYPEDGAGGIDVDQMTLQTTLTAVGETQAVMTAAVPANTPTSGQLRIQRDDGQYTLHAYNAVSGSTFTFTSGSEDFNTGSNPATANNNVYVAYIDKTVASGTESYNTVQTVSQDLYVEARFGGTPSTYSDAIKPAVTIGTLGSTGGSVSLNPVSDA